MNDQQRQIAQQCKKGAEDNTMDFPEIVTQLVKAGFDRYVVDFCTGNVAYYLPNGESLILKASEEKMPIAEFFNIEAIQAAIKEAQIKVVSYTYKGFCKKIMVAGCVGYMVSFLGKRAVYFGRTGETHVEYFPK